MLLNTENFHSGFLIDDELLGGVAEVSQPDGSRQYSAYVMQHTTGQYLGYQVFEKLNDALEKINEVKRPWSYEAVSSCGNGSCGKCVSCHGSTCRNYNTSTVTH